MYSPFLRNLRHSTTVHSCDVCGRVVKSAHALRAHKRMAHDNKDEDADPAESPPARGRKIKRWLKSTNRRF